VTASGNDNEGHVWIWDAASGHLLRKLQDRFEHKKAAFRFATFSPDGRRILTAGEDNTAQVWDLASGERVGQPIRHKDWVYRASYSKDGRFIVTASQDTFAQLCDAETGRQVLPPWKHMSPVRSAEFSPDGRYVVTGGGDFTARIWNVATGELLNPPLRQSGQQVVYAAFSPEGRYILTANANGVVCLWDMALNNRLPRASRSTSSSDGERLATINGNQITIWNTRTNSVAAKIDVAGELLAARLNRDGSRLAAIFFKTNSTGDVVTNAQVWNGLTGAQISPAFPIRTEIKHPLPMMAPDGQRLVTLDGADVRIWDASLGKPLFLLRHDSMVAGASFSPDSNWLVIWGGTNVVVWETATGRRGHTLPHPDEVNHAEFSPDNLLLVTSCNSPGTWYERDAQIWSVATGKKVGPPLHHGDGVLHASFSPDGKRIVTGSEDGTVRVWELGTGRQLWYRDLHAQVSDASFSQDGRWIVTACEDHTARVWDAEIGEPITPPLKRPEPFFFANFIANGLAVVSLTSKGSAVKWDLTRDERPIDDLRSLARLLSGHQSGGPNGASSQATGSLQEVWHKLRTNYPASFETPSREILAWHHHEAEASEEDKNWPAAIFHWDKLIELQPTDAQFRERRALAQAALDDSRRSPSGH
ncbi:MAG TPA: WD40 repeat domain-containing protein, partial [Candidatus Nitrosotalea sp.]|nr:WD40 repeat domain-containing protein [Candidatus Nitrosotalea sp.]